MEANLQKYFAFVTAAESGSFTQAAELLNYSQSGISRMISDLEKEWNVTLMERNRSGISLTSEGKHLLPFVKDICRNVESLQMEIDSLNGMEKGLIRIATFSSVATHWLPKMIKAFKEDYPGIDFELRMGNYDEIEEWVIGGIVDCGFLHTPVDQKLETIYLDTDRLLVALPEDHPLADCERFPVKALEDDPFIFPQTGSHTDVEPVFKKHDIKPDIRYSTFDDYAIMSMVESGLGISILPELILKRAPYRIVLKELEDPAYRDISLIIRSRENAPLAVKRFLEYLEYRK